MSPERGPGLSIHVLGPLDVLVDGAPLLVDTRKALAVLVLLAVERRPFARDELAVMLWPEADDESARGALRRTLSVLRAGLHDRWLRVDRSAVALEEPFDLDLAEVERAAAAGDPGSLHRAASLARGPFLAGFTLRDSPAFDDWHAMRASAADRLVGTILERVAENAAARGDLSSAAAAAERRVQLDQLDEGAHRRLIALLAARDRGAAIRQYRTLVAILDRELGVAPLPETTALYEAIRDGALPAPGSVEVAAPLPVGAPDGRAGPSAESRAATPPPILPLVGRTQEVGALLAAHAASAPDGRIAVLEGEAGIGKTRLAEEVSAAVLAVGGTVLAARAYAAESGIAFGPVVELLRSAIALPSGPDRLAALSSRELAELDRLVTVPGAAGSVLPTGDSPAGRVRLLDAVASALAVLAKSDVPGLIRIDDLQWADEATRELLLYLARRLEGRHVLLLLAWRPEDLDDLGATFAERIRELPTATVMRLERLTRADVAALVEATGGSPARVAPLLAESEGLPLFLVEALADGARPDDGPRRSIRTLLHERLAAVGGTAAQVLAAAAVIGRSFDLTTVRAAAGRSEDETIASLEELVRRGLVREVAAAGDVRYDFAHGRLREAAYESISLARRRLLHRRAADAFRARAGWRDDLERLMLIASHEREGGRDAEAAEAFREAGLRARAVYAHHEAATAFDAALALGHPDVVGLQVAIGDVRRAGGDYDAAISAFEAAAAAAGADALGDIEARLGQVHALRGDLATAASHLDAALAALGSPADVPAARRALVQRSLVALWARDTDRAASAAGDALAAAEAARDGSASGMALRTLGLIARARGDLTAARDALSRSLVLAADDADPAAAIAAGNALALVEAAAGDREAAIGHLRAALDACRRTGERHLEAAVENNLADQLQATGRREEAMEHLKRAVALFADVGGTEGRLEPEIWKLVAW